MPYQTGLLEAFDDYGVRYRVEPGALTRGHPNFDPRGGVWHWTWTQPIGCSWPCGPLLMNGRGGPNPVAGPLCNWSTDVCGLVHVVALGRANHAGSGSWRGLVGNRQVWGDELEHRGGTFPEVQLESARLAAVAAADYSGFDSVMWCDHYEWTARKIDRNTLNPDNERLAVEIIRRNKGLPVPDPEPVLPNKEHPMVVLEPVPGVESWGPRLVTESWSTHITTPANHEALRFSLPTSRIDSGMLGRIHDAIEAAGGYVR